MSAVVLVITNLSSQRNLWPLNQIGTDLGDSRKLTKKWFPKIRCRIWLHEMVPNIDLKVQCPGQIGKIPTGTTYFAPWAEVVGKSQEWPGKNADIDDVSRTMSQVRRKIQMDNCIKYYLYKVNRLNSGWQNLITCQCHAIAFDFCTVQQIIWNMNKFYSFITEVIWIKLNFTFFAYLIFCKNKTVL